jgi:hypothetical protein
MARSRRVLPLGNADKVLRRAYAQQLDMIGDILVRAELITRRDIQRDGVAFAVRNRFEPKKITARRL